MDKMMYIMHVPWSWIKQRPHFLAEYLNKYFYLDVYFQDTYIKKNKCCNKSNNINLIKLKRLPLRRISILNKINNIFLKIVLKDKIKNYKYIWFTDIFMYNVLSEYISKEKLVIYDCMDDLLEFPIFKSSRNKTNEAIRAEKALIERSNYVFFSSEYLREIVCSRYNEVCVREKSHIINNAIHLPSEDSSKKEIDNKKTKYKSLVYIGTVASWIDFDLILKSLLHNSEIIYKFYGPLDTDLPINDRIVYGGLLEHHQIFPEMEKADALIMPFKPTNLILSVNPVKLYEYISACRPIISIKYGETEKFERYAYLYSNAEEYMKYLDKLSIDQLPLKVSEECYINFAKANTWESRVKEILNVIKVK